MKLKIILFLFLSISLFAQNSNNYINIKGTKLSIMPPSGFKESKKMIGLEKNDDCIIQIMDLVGGNFESNTATYKRSEFEKRGITVLDFQELKIDGYDALFSNIKGNDANEMVNVIFGDNTFSVMITAIYPSSSRNELFPEIKNSFLKIKYNKSLIVDPFAASTFIVEKNDSKFKFAKASANMFLFSENGTVKDSYENEPMVMVTSFAIDKTFTTESVMESCINGILQQGAVKKETKNISSKSINGYDTLQAECYFEHKSKTKLNYITILIKDNVAIAIYGMAETKFDENLLEFKKIVNKVRIKY